MSSSSSSSLKATRRLLRLFQGLLIVCALAFLCLQQFQTATSCESSNNHDNDVPSATQHMIMTSHDETTLLNKNDDERIIPHILHFVHVTPGLPEEQQEPLPAAVGAIINEWQALHPSWQIMIWNNTVVHQELPGIIPIVKKLKAMAWVADLVRYHALYQFGGVYLDTDVAPLQPLDALLNAAGQRQHGAFTVCEKPAQKSVDFPGNNNLTMPAAECELTCNAVMGAKRRHDALRQVIVASTENTLKALAKQSPAKKQRYRTKITGPPVWSRVALNTDNDDIEILRSFSFYPCNWDNKTACIREKYVTDPRVYAMHTWAQTWWGQQS